MTLREIRAYLLPGSAEREPGFRQLIEKQSVLGLRITAGVTVGASVFGTVTRFALMRPENGVVWERLAAMGWLVGLGLAAFWAARTEAGRARARGLAMTLAVLVTLLLNHYTLRLSAVEPVGESYIPSQLALVLLIGVAALPMRPMQTLGLGLGLGLCYLVQANVAKRMMGLGSGAIPEHLLFIFTISVTAAGVAGVLYRQRYVNYQGYVRSLEAAEQLRRAETRVLLSDHAASLGRLAAALSHELNSPIGVMRSAVDTLMLINARLLDSEGTERQRLVRLQADLRRSLQQSADRLTAIVSRMQRFTNMDRAEIVEADMNELLSDAASLVRAEFRGRVEIELELSPVPRLLSRPTQLSAVFHGVLSNAAAAVNEGAGRVRVRSGSAGDAVEILVEDNGKGMSREALAAIFEPGFQATGGRMAASNWSMFSFRRILREHGGEIEVESKEGQGTRVRIQLPCEACLQESSV